MLNGESVTTDPSNSVSAQSTSHYSGSSAGSTAGNQPSNERNTPSPTSEDSTTEDRKKRKSPAVSMAEAAVMSQEAALLEANNF